MVITDAIDEYITAVRAERGLARNTTAAYRRDLDQYAAFLAEAGLIEIDSVDHEAVAGFVKHLADRGLAASTRGRKIAAVRNLHRFLVAEDLVGHDPTSLIDSPRRPANLPHVLTTDEVAALIEAADGPGPLDRRDKAILEFMYASGARVAETVSLDLLDLDLDESVALVTGKGSRQRLVPLGGYAVRALRAYLPVRLELKGDRPDANAVFLSSRGRRLSRQAIWQLIKKRARAAGIEPSRTSPHVLRHSAATHMVEGGADLRSVQEILGHASISTTQVYTRVSPRHLHEVFVQAHPRGS